MESIKLNQTKDTPNIILDKSEGDFWFKGTSIPENARTFYQSILEWIDEYIKNPNEETIVNFKMDYFNTSSTKYLFDIMVKFKEIAKDEKMLIFNWYFHEEDKDMFDAGQNFSKMMRFSFNFVMYK